MNRPAGSMFRDLERASGEALDKLMATRRGPEPGILVDGEYRGLNLVPGAHILGVRKFIKGFFRDPATGEVGGYNVAVEQDGDHAAWVRKGQRFGFFTVNGASGATEVSSMPGSRPAILAAKYPAATLLDYGRSRRNDRWRPERLLRDFVVVPDPVDPGVLLGKAYLAVGPRLVRVGWFVLKRIEGPSGAG